MNQSWGGSNFVNIASLESARHRHKWAASRLALLEETQSTLQVANSKITVREEWDREPFETLDRLENVEIEIANIGSPQLFLGDVQMITGEVVYHLRTILDYLVYNLAWKDSGYERKGTAFPTVGNAADWSKISKRLLKGCTAEHKAIIQGYQPYMKCEWTARLNVLANQDKHRTWFDVPIKISANARLHDIAVPVPGKPDRLQATFSAPPPVYEFPDDQSPVVDTLKDLVRQVDELLVRFEPEFPRQGFVPVAVSADADSALP